MSEGAREHGRRAGALAAMRVPYEKGSPEWRSFLTNYVAALLEEAFKERSAAAARFGSFAE